MAAPQLNDDQVVNVLKECLFRDGEDATNAVIVEGIVNTYGFDPDRLKTHEEEIVRMLAELPKQFRKSGGGGWSFLQACEDRHGRQWTGLHRTMEGLFVLGMAVGKVQCQLPREFWNALPGGMPYYVVEL